MSAGRRLLRALQASARRAGCVVTVTDATEQSWASATFVGTQHAISLNGMNCARMAAWLERLRDTDVTVPGHVVANLMIEGTTLRVLTLEV